MELGFFEANGADVRMGWGAWGNFGGVEVEGLEGEVVPEISGKLHLEGESLFARGVLQ